VISTEGRFVAECQGLRPGLKREALPRRWGAAAASLTFNRARATFDLWIIGGSADGRSQNIPERRSRRCLRWFHSAVEIDQENGSQSYDVK
jgi:hypothetical protein